MLHRKTYVAQAFEELYYGTSHKTGLKKLLNQSSELTLATHYFSNCNFGKH